MLCSALIMVEREESAVDRSRFSSAGGRGVSGSSSTALDCFILAWVLISISVDLRLSPATFSVCLSASLSVSRGRGRNVREGDGKVVFVGQDQGDELSQKVVAALGLAQVLVCVEESQCFQRERIIGDGRGLGLIAASKYSTAQVEADTAVVRSSCVV